MVILLLLAGCSERPPEAKAREHTLTLFVAASLVEVIQEVGARFEAREPVQLVYNFASSGALAQQLMAAPRGDVFLSASEAWMDRVEDADRLVSGSRTCLLSNKLVIIADGRAAYELDSPWDLAALPFHYLSIGDPAYVPVGRYAMQWMDSFYVSNKVSLWDHVQDRIAPAPDARSTLAQVKGHRNVVGIVYRTDYLPWADQLKLLATIPAEGCPQIRYPAAIIASSQEKEMASCFLKFLQSSEMREIFEQHGFSVIADRQ